MKPSTHREWRASRGIAVIFLSILGLTVSSAAAVLPSRPIGRPLSFEQRVAAQRATEEVYWRHRVWPKENPTPKPALSVVLPDDVIRAEVEDYLQKSNALATWWQRPITTEQLQAELDRMARGTRDPEMLRELYAALGNDGFLIAETLARPTLVGRLIRDGYAADDRFHGAVKREAERALARTRSLAEMKALGGEYVERTIVRRADDRDAFAVLPEGDALDLDPGEWNEWSQALARQFGTSPESMPVQQLSGLQEDSDRFFATAVLSLDAGEAVVATVVWYKRSFDAWWSEERVATSADIVAELWDYAVAAPMGGGCIDDTWEHRYYGPTARQRHTVVWTGTEMIVWGGENGVGESRTGGRYNPATDSWTAVATGVNVPTHWYDHTAVWTGTEMIVWGGRGGPGGQLNIGGRYNPSSNSWTVTTTESNPPAWRYAHTAVWTGTEMIIWGGVLTQPSPPWITGSRYNPTFDNWTEMTTSANTPPARTGHSAVWTGADMIVWGGFDGNGSYLNTGGRYTPSTDSWTATSTAGGANLPVGRWSHTAVWTGAEMIVWGGYNGSYLNTGGRYDPATDEWLAMATGADVPVGRSDHTAVWTGTAMIAWGGYNGSYLNTGGRYTPSTNSWAATSSANVPVARKGHRVVWTGTELVVWGGYNGNYLNTGGRYYPATDNWTASPTIVNVPSARYGTTAVWTGTEMIVWGGYNGSYPNTGGRYNPTTDSWTPTPTGATVPSGREEHTVVWTGTEMIVWGGLNATGHLNTGSRYNPMTDRWTPTPTGANVPSGRRLHTAVWTGTEMIAWGGINSSHLNTGGRYDPASDSWAATSTGENVPSLRSLHTAVWTGTEMIVWGGQYASNLNTGGRYTPSTNSWAATSIANVPSVRNGHKAVWTGTEMIVWGGYNNILLKTGGRFNPSTGSWAATSTGENVPSARRDHTAVWTGTEMIVWGGYESNLNTGGRYYPPADDWRATSTGTNVPPGRSDHTAVWTGTQMIVWGGYPLDYDLYLYCADCELETFYLDADGDGRGLLGSTIQACTEPPSYSNLAGDCNDADETIWTIPGEVRDVRFPTDTATLVWATPTEIGGQPASLRYDTIRSTIPSDFDVAGVCIETNDGTDLTASDPADPLPGVVFHYLIRPENDCGVGPLGNATSGPRPAARACP